MLRIRRLAVRAAAGEPGQTPLRRLDDNLQARGVDLIVTGQAIDTTTRAGRMMFHVLAAIRGVRARPDLGAHARGARSRSRAGAWADGPAR